MALTDKLSAIGNAIREKGGTTALLTLDEMPTAIGAIETGGGGGGDIPEEAWIMNGDCQYRFCYDGWNWFAENANITTKDMTNAQHMFYFSGKLTKIPFTLNFKQGTEVTIKNICYYCRQLKNPPVLGAIKVKEMEGMFYGCENIVRFPEGYGSNIDWSYMEAQTGAYNCAQQNMFQNCNRLREVPMGLMKSGNPYIVNSYSMYYGAFSSCYVLDEVVNLPVPYTKTTWTSNVFGTTVSRCYRLKTLTFATNEDGSPIVVKWKSQTLDLSADVGYSYSTNLNNYMERAVEFKTSDGDERYQEIKDDPDFWTKDKNYSRYNHDSAVATINSLPDTSAYLASAGGTNTIKFTGVCGAKTDGGAINTLTEEEIAVAAAKGWTVSLV